MNFSKYGRRQSERATLREWSWKHMTRVTLQWASEREREGTMEQIWRHKSFGMRRRQAAWPHTTSSNGSHALSTILVLHEQLVLILALQLLHVLQMVFRRMAIQILHEQLVLVLALQLVAPVWNLCCNWYFIELQQFLLLHITLFRVASWQGCKHLTLQIDFKLAGTAVKDVYTAMCTVNRQCAQCNVQWIHWHCCQGCTQCIGNVHSVQCIGNVHSAANWICCRFTSRPLSTSALSLSSLPLQFSCCCLLELI